MTKVQDDKRQSRPNIISDPVMLVDRASMQYIIDETTKENVLYLEAVGSVSNVVYKSGRTIPRLVQEQGIKRTLDSGRQLNSFIEHPDPWEPIQGDTKEIAAIVVAGPTLDGDKTKVKFRVASTPNGQLLKQLLESKVELGISQRALGIEEPRTVDFENEAGYDTPTAQLIVVQEIQGIYGYDFVQLDTANAGNVTKVRQVSDSVLAASRAVTEKDEKHMSGKPGATSANAQPAANAAEAIVDSTTAEQNKLEDAVKLLATQITDMASKIEAMASADSRGKEVATSAASAKAAVLALLEDSTISTEEKNSTLQAVAVSIQDAFSKQTGISVDPAAVAKLDALKAANAATSAIADSMKNMLAAETEKSRVTEMESALGTILDSVGGEGFDAAERTSLLDRLKPRVSSLKTKEEVAQLVEDSLAMVNMGRASERLVSVGYKGKPAMQTNQSSSISITDSYEHLKYVKFLQDRCAATGIFTPMLDHSTGKLLRASGEAVIHPALKSVLDRWDQRHGVDLRREQEAAMRAGGGKLTDSTLHADFETPYTIARMVLFEAYANDIVLGITAFGTMDNDRDTVPITKWRRTSTSRKTFLPNLRERTEIKVGELQTIPEGKLTTDWFPIDASPRKLRALLSDEFITRARRRPDISGVAMALQNLTEDVRRCLQQDIFYLMLKAGLSNGAVNFTSAQNGNGTTTIFQVTSATSQTGAIAISAADAQAIVPESMTVTIGGAAIPEWGTTTTGGGVGSAFFYTADYANGLIQFVDAAGAPLAPATGTGNVAVTAGKKAAGISGRRVNLTAPNGVEHDVYMNRFLFAIQNLASEMPSTTGYSPNILLQQRNIATLTQQAKAYSREGARRAFNGDAGPVIDGNFGTTADLRHFASSVFPANFTIVGQQEATLYRIYEPLVMRGPVESHNADGQLNGGKEWYSYQEDALAVPLTEKLAVITTYST